MLVVHRLSPIQVSWIYTLVIFVLFSHRSMQSSRASWPLLWRRSSWPSWTFTQVSYHPCQRRINTSTDCWHHGHVWPGPSALSNESYKGCTLCIPYRSMGRATVVLWSSVTRSVHLFLKKVKDGSCESNLSIDVLKNKINRNNVVPQQGGQTQCPQGPHQHYGCTQRAGCNFKTISLINITS